MSSFMKKGKRDSVNKDNKKRLEYVMRILEELDRVAIELVKYSMENKKTINKEDIEELAKGMTDLPIGGLEVSLLWSKINDFEQRINANRGARTEDDTNKD